MQPTTTFRFQNGYVKGTYGRTHAPQHYACRRRRRRRRFQNGYGSRPPTLFRRVTVVVNKLNTTTKNKPNQPKKQKSANANQPSIALLLYRYCWIPSIKMVTPDVKLFVNTTRKTSRTIKIKSGKWKVTIEFSSVYHGHQPANRPITCAMVYNGVISCV